MFFKDNQIIKNKFKYLKTSFIYVKTENKNSETEEIYSDKVRLKFEMNFSTEKLSCCRIGNTQQEIPIRKNKT